MHHAPGRGSKGAHQPRGATEVDGAGLHIEVKTSGDPQVPICRPSIMSRSQRVTGALRPVTVATH